jgi:D-alanyl-lipoteichoic acid acyltransferase DltB (MBOAT superfamily)
LFLAASVLIFYLLASKYRWAVLLLLSYFFYTWAEPSYCLIIFGVTIVSYGCGRWLQKSPKKSILYFSVLAICAPLFYFKYFDWIYNSYFEVLHSNLENFTALSILLPIGISFYTFQAISYVVDIYRNRQECEKHFGYYALYLSFFPQLVAGPIEKAKDLIPQFKTKTQFDLTNIIAGSKLIVFGLVKKIVIADSLLLFFRDTLSNIDNPAYSGIDYLIAIFCFLYYVYCDFSGYCDIATGSATMFGVKLSMNFDRPFTSMNFRELWSRWHISLSKWLKNYIFEPLGGRVENNVLKTLINVLVTFLIAGIWHGDSLNFILFGGALGLLVVMDQATKTLRSDLFKKLAIKSDNKLFIFACRFTVFFLFSLTCVFSGIEDTATSFLYLEKLTVIGLPTISLKVLLWLLFLVIGTEILNRLQMVDFYNPFNAIKNDYVRIALIVGLIFTVIIFSDRGTNQFYYFQF